MSKSINIGTKLYSQGFQNRERIEVEKLIGELTTEIDYLRALVSKQSQYIAELQSRVDPYSQDGNAICNSIF